jgi:RNA-directed DNA polymerase
LVFVGFELTLTDIRVSPDNIQRFQNKISQKLEKEKSYKFSDKPRERFFRLIDSVINKKIQGRPEKLCPVCEGLLDKNHRNWVGFFSVVTDTQQFHDLDKWIRVQLCQYFYETYQIRLKRRDFREAGLASIKREHYNNHKSKKCSCKPLNFKYILYWVLLARQFDFLEEAITAHLGVEILKK